VTAFQWGWKFDYPTYGVSGATDLYMPVNKQVVFKMESLDVIHSFFVPEFRMKQDVVPGRETELRVTPIEIGDYKVRCAELCGASHAYMLAPVHVVSQADFDAWIQGQLTAATQAVTSGPDPARGQQLAQANGCLACHSTDGSKIVGPTWKGLFNSQVNLSDGTTVTADEAYLQESIHDPNAKVVAGFEPNVMPQFSLSDAQVADLVAFIKTLK
jgi:cytochrome c oxidase subunit 2